MIPFFIIDGIISNYLFIPLILIYFYYGKNKYSFLIGLLYDIVYTNTLFLNAFLFFLISYLINKIKNKNIIYFIIIINLYHVILYIILLLLKYNIFTYEYLSLLFKQIIINTVIIIIINIIHKKTNRDINFIGDNSDIRRIFKRKKYEKK